MSRQSCVRRWRLCADGWQGASEGPHRHLSIAVRRGETEGRIPLALRNFSNKTQRTLPQALDLAARWLAI